MEPETKKMLEKVYELTEENNQMLHKIRSVQKRAHLIATVKFILFVLFVLGAYYYLQPYILKVFEIYSNLSNIGQAGANPDALQSLFDNIEGLNLKNFNSPR